MVIITTPNFLKAFEINENIKDTPIGTGLNESQLRPLTNLEPYIYIFLYKVLKL